MSQAAIELDMRTDWNSFGLVARKIWQQLFNFYRDGGGILSRMDSLLCDLSLIEKEVKRAQEQRRPIIRNVLSNHKGCK